MLQSEWYCDDTYVFDNWVNYSQVEIFSFCRGDVAKPEIYHPKESQPAKDADAHLTEDNSISPGKESLLVKDETFPELAPGRSSTEVSFLVFCAIVCFHLSHFMSSGRTE